MLLNPHQVFSVHFNSTLPIGGWRLGGRARKPRTSRWWRRSAWKSLSQSRWRVDMEDRKEWIELAISVRAPMVGISS